ncbi:iron-siderophore ABC transporter substrate-binding protein [Brevibacillus humidisoli]|uniref:ABC transporter substrate-binding protein n=1 Tax=Brevibacillus humidisoli TaxID=2895522 RepID=UPI001E4E902C|nr:iron-siderophore ABC transporter substrate-binding protein [Brevibacillus humidisoli]UFJ39569.1 iron-siderophore ABC transporter substrate-binding protein [Brevibacillus humidisoli]
MVRQHRFYTGFFATALVLILMMVTGCGNQATPESGSNNASAPAENTENSSSGTAPQEEAARVVKHAMGETKIKGTPEKVVILTNEGTEALLALGVKPVGAVKSWLGDPWYEHIKAEMEGVTVVGDEMQPNIELIASLQPDLIIGSKVRQEKVYNQLSQIAPTVFSETFSGSWKENFMLYAEALNKQAEAEQVMSDFDQKIADAKEKLGDKLSSKVSIVRFLPGSARIYYKDSFSGVILEQLGFNRPESQQKDMLTEEVTKERIPEMDGDILFYFVWEDNPGESKGADTAKEWMNDPLWKNLEVVKQNNVHEVSDAIWNTAGGVKAANLMVDELLGYFE